MAANSGQYVNALISHIDLAVMTFRRQTDIMPTTTSVFTSIRTVNALPQGAPILVYNILAGTQMVKL